MRLPNWSTVERTARFTGGMAFFAHEVFVSSTERPYVLVAILGLLGLGEMVRLDLRKKDEDQA